MKLGGKTLMWIAIGIGVVVVLAFVFMPKSTALPSGNSVPPATTPTGVAGAEYS